LREQWVVTLALTPLGLLLFGQVSLVGLLANLLAIPWVTLVVTPLAFAGVVWAPLWQAAAWGVQGLAWVLQWLAAWPWAQVSVPAAPLWAGLAGVAGGVLLALRLPWPVRLLGLPLVLPVLLWQDARPVPGRFELLAADVGQGNAVLVRTATHTLLYDAGPRYSRVSDAGARVLVPLLRALGERVDVLMLSHRDSDHTGGAAAVLAQQPQARLTGSVAGDPAWSALGPVAPCLAGQRWQWDGVAFELLHPLPDTAGRGPPGQRSNALSCVLRVTDVQGTAALLAGDIEAAQEQALVARGAPLKADVLLVPHHGSKTSSSAPFLDAVQPRTALVQAAYRSRFGHPAPEVVQRLRARGIALVESPRCGAATWASEQPQQVRCERDAQPRYWQHRMP
jgi:competence protein ComEC